MKKKCALVLSVLLILALAACAKEASVKKTVEGNIRTYDEMSDGTWRCEAYAYQYRLAISGRMPQAAGDSTFVYLSNREDISFEQAWKASGLSDNLEDYFSPEEAVLVEFNVTDSSGTNGR